MENLKKEKQNQTQKEYDEYTQRKLEKRNNYTIEDRHILGKFSNTEFGKDSDRTKRKD